ncbi:unnamed protein product [Peronospora destructor]|uniref:Uncharacterized protein n=1 Tax=Peronospora destructor TaxID=86335 RepID=A0AAV0VB94_9STRA|nr:unnamed protein product [Peronospora destructor]
MRGSTEPIKREPPGWPAKPPDPGDGKEPTQRDRNDPNDGQTTVAEAPPLPKGADTARLEPTATETGAPASQGKPRSGGVQQPGLPGHEGQERRYGRRRCLRRSWRRRMQLRMTLRMKHGWLASIAELYTIAHDTVAIAAELVPTGKQLVRPTRGLQRLRSKGEIGWMP